MDTPDIPPHREDGSIDRDAFAAHIEWLIAAGVDGIINRGSTGEYYAQSMDKRREMASFARELTKGRVHLMVATVAIRQEDSIAMAEHAARIGADSIRFGSPPLCGAHRTGKRAECACHRPRRRSADHAVERPRPHGHQHGRGVP